MHFYNPIMCVMRASEMIKNTTNVLVDVNLIIHGRDNL